MTFEKAEAYREGNQASQSPEHQLTLWTGYRFDRSILDGARAGLGVRHVRDMQADDANTKEVPDYTLVDVALAYNFAKQGMPGVTAQLNVNNLLDKKYVASCYNSTDYCYFGAEGRDSHGLLPVLMPGRDRTEAVIASPRPGI